MTLVYDLKRFGKISVSHVQMPNPDNAYWAFADEKGNLLNADEPWDDDANHPPSEAMVLGWMLGGEIINKAFEFE
jgi:hypothetical protein